MCAQSCLTYCNPMDCPCQAPLSMGFSRQGYRRELPFLTLGDLLDRGIKPTSLALAGGFFYHRSTSSKSSVWCLCVKRDTQGECHMKTEEESGVCIYKLRNTKCCWQARKAGRGKAWLSLRASRARQPR